MYSLRKRIFSLEFQINNILIVTKYNKHKYHFVKSWNQLKNNLIYFV